MYMTEIIVKAFQAILQASALLDCKDLKSLTKFTVLVSISKRHIMLIQLKRTRGFPDLWILNLNSLRV